MRRLLSATLIGLALLVAAGAATASAESGATVLVTQNCTQGVQRPQEIIFFCGDSGAYAYKLRWSRWGGVLAVGRGTFAEKICQPDCATGGVQTHAVTIRLSRRRVCSGRSHLYYHRASLSFAGAGGRSLAVACPF